MTTPISERDDAPEQTKWEVEKAFREREISIKEAEIDLKRKEHAVSRWRNPLIVAILAASIAAIGSTAVALLNGIYSRQVESQRSDEERILEMIKTGDPGKVVTNLKFLLSAGLISDADTRAKLGKFLTNPPPGDVPVLPTTSSSDDTIRTVISDALERQKELEKSVQDLKAQLHH
jgi:predicted MarR family transcription regulator